MATKKDKMLDPLSIKNLGVYGVIRPVEIDDNLIADEAVTGVKNFHFNQRGAATTRLGLSAIGSTIINRKPMPAYGFHNTLSNTAIVVFNEAGSAGIYSYDGSNWGISLSGGDASVSVRFADFGSYTIAVNFDSSMYVWAGGANGASYWYSTGHSINPDDMWGYTPQLIEIYKSKVYLFGDTSTSGDPSRLYFSTIIDSFGSITFDPTTDYVDINPGDGEGGTGLYRFLSELLCFKPNHIYRFNTSGVDPDPIIRIGTRSQESIVEGVSGVYFHHDTGFYAYTGDFPTRISDAINDFIQAIPFSQYSKIAGWKDGDNIYWSVGNLTIPETNENVEWKNVVLCFTESTSIWTIYSYAHDIRRGMNFYSNNASTIVVGLDNGVVAAFNIGGTDLGEPIHCWLRTKWQYADSVAYSKLIMDLVTVCEKAQGLTLMYQTDNDSTRWKTIGQLNDYINEFRNNNIRFRRIRFNITGSNKQEPAIFRSIEIVKGILEGFIKDTNG